MLSSVSCGANADARQSKNQAKIKKVKKSGVSLIFDSTLRTFSLWGISFAPLQTTAVPIFFKVILFNSMIRIRRVSAAMKHYIVLFFLVSSAVGFTGISHAPASSFLFSSRECFAFYDNHYFLSVSYSQ